MKTNICKPVVLGLILSFLLNNACAPLNSSFESARTLKKGEVELMGNYSKYKFVEDGESEDTNDNFGLRIGYGVTDNFDVKLRYERLSPELGTDANYLAVAPKFGLKKDYIAFTIPVGAYFIKTEGESESEFFTSPKLLFTYLVSKKFEATFASKADIFFEEDADMLLGFNLGLGFSNDLNRWAIRPEVGMMINPGEEGSVWTFGVGINYNIKSKK